VVLGVRSAESQNRSDAGVAERPGKSKREKQVFDFDNGDKGIISPCQMKAKIKIHPIVDWTDRDEIIVLLPDRTAGSVVKALDVLEKKYGRRKFRRTFKTITCDNGSEFADCQGMEHTHYGRGPRTKIYYCHPYSAYERGSNENANGLIRRFFPKGTDFSKVTKKAVRQVQDWMNQYPRKILGWKSAEDMMSIFMSSA
jgi:IS30 family transposase